jgi:Flp pilus assembly protein TadB
MSIELRLLWAYCLPDLQEVKEQRRRRQRLLILILVAGATTTLIAFGNTLSAALTAIVAVVAVAAIVARYLLGRHAVAASSGR